MGSVKNDEHRAESYGSHLLSFPWLSLSVEVDTACLVGLTKWKPNLPVLDHPTKWFKSEAPLLFAQRLTFPEFSSNSNQKLRGPQPPHPPRQTRRTRPPPECNEAQLLHLPGGPRDQRAPGVHHRRAQPVRPVVADLADRTKSDGPALWRAFWNKRPWNVLFSVFSRNCVCVCVCVHVCFMEEDILGFRVLFGLTQ